MQLTAFEKIETRVAKEHDPEAKRWWGRLLQENRDLMHIVEKLLCELDAAGMSLGEFYRLRERKQSKRG